MKNRLLSMILAISMVLTFLPVSAIPAFAADESSTQPMSGNCGYSGSNLTYTLTKNNEDNDNPTYTLKIEGTGKMDVWRNDEDVPWYSVKKKITQLDIDGATSIGKYAFYGCSGLTEITIPNSVTSIGELAFSGCSKLTEITIPDSVTSMYRCAFSSCKGAAKVKISSNLKVIEERVFADCSSLTDVTIPDGVTKLGEYAFSYCSNLESVIIPDSVTAIGEGAFSRCIKLNEKDGTSILPAHITSIGNSVFFGCSGLTKITIPASVTSIGASAFVGCSSLTEITIPTGVTSIEQQTFSGCSKLTTINGLDHVTSIGSLAFENCISLTEIAIPTAVTSIKGRTFNGCSKLTTINGLDHVTSIEYAAFEGCSSLTEIRLSDDEVSIGDSAFENCSKLSRIEGGEKLTAIGVGAFRRCIGLKEITIPSTVQSIGNNAFLSCSSLNSVKITEGVTTIGSGAFQWCYALTEIELPNSVTSIGSQAFYDIGQNFTVLVLPKTVPSIGENAFCRDDNLKIYYPDVKSAWKSQKIDKTKIIGLQDDTFTIYSKDYYSKTTLSVIYLCDVTFDANGGTLASTMPTGPVKVYRTEYVTSTKANELTSIDAPTRTGYTFAGWYTSATPQKDDTAFNLAATAVQDDMTLYAAWTANGCIITVPENCAVKDADTNTKITVDDDHKANVKYDQKITITAPELADGDAYEWVNGETTETDTDNEYTFTVAGNTAIECNLLKALHITNEGKPNTTGTKYDADKRTYYGNGWEYSETAGLTIKANADLSNEPAVTVNVTVETGKTVSNAKLEGSVTNNGTLSNCVLDKAPTGGTVKNSLFGAKPDGIDVKTLTEADGKDITAKLDGVKDGSLTGKTLWFVGTPKLTATVENTEIKHINHTAVTESGITGIDGNVTANADHSVTFTPDGNENILLNNRTAESGDFTFTTPEDCTYDGNVHKVDGITSTTYMDSDYTVKYDYKKPDGTPGETEEPKNAGTYTVKIVMSDGQTIDTGKSFTIKPAQPGKDDFEFVKDLPSGVTEDRDDSEKTAEVKLKSDSLFQKNGADVEQEYQKKNADGEWENVAAPSGKGEYKLVATVTTTDPNLTGGTVEWEFTILDREDANWLTMSVEDGKITKVTRPAADDAEAEEDITEKVLLTASADGSKTAYKVPADAQVTVTANDAPQDMKFEMWRFSVNSMNGDTTLALYSRSMTFTLKDDIAGLTVSAMYQDAAIDSGYDILGPAAAATTAVVGSAILAYQGHMLGTELYLIYLLPSGAVIPANRIQLAMLLWQDAGNPAPVDETLYTDIDANDTDAMQAAQWAVETGLMELPDADSAPDQFDPYAAVSNVDVIHAWKKAQKVKG